MLYFGTTQGTKMHKKFFWTPLAFRGSSRLLVAKIHQGRTRFSIEVTI